MLGHEEGFYSPIRLGDSGLTLLELRHIIIFLASFRGVFLIRGGIAMSFAAGWFLGTWLDWGTSLSICRRAEELIAIAIAVAVAVAVAVIYTSVAVAKGIDGGESSRWWTSIRSIWLRMLSDRYSGRWRRSEVLIIVATGLVPWGYFARIGPYPMLVTAKPGSRSASQQGRESPRNIQRINPHVYSRRASTT